MKIPFLSWFWKMKAPLLSGAVLYTQSPAADDESESYYRAPQSYSITRDPDMPRYARRASGTGWDVLQKADWLDLGLDYRFRYEHRDDDLRRDRAQLDEPLLHRTRAYVAIHDVLDPFRFAVEMQDSRRYNSNFPRDNRDVNEFQIIRLYAELYLDQALGMDPLGNRRPLSLRYGIHNFEFLDRRLIGNNQWRNTTNAFQGFQGALGQESNDWQLDLLAVQPLKRDLYTWDEPVRDQWFYAAIGHWRLWSDIITLEPYYLALHQSAYEGVAERLLHSPGLRGYGTMGKTGFDYDFSLTYQLGSNGSQNVKAYAGTAEMGYRFQRPWSPRLSLFYGYASGDRDPNDHEDNRFERFFGFGRPWSANDYIVYENISTPKLRLELTPDKKVRMDLGCSFYWLASDTDRFSAAGLRDSQGRSGSMIGHEFDGRVRLQVTQKVEAILGYAHFTPGDFTRNQGRAQDTDFAYLEISIKAF